MDETPQLGQSLELDEGRVLFFCAGGGLGLGFVLGFWRNYGTLWGFGVRDLGRGLGFVMIAWESKLGVQDL